ncbi:hypothetical protein ILUMI_03124 [Ignelater luminosus]|uniref:Uncharacterized protein n=1 Tax=Ignelater luminosus TaxID=2038154 RepID=A0A8K0DBK0_IGNLU|nr:hypothetical protein ILUMI_03124 [Ignelater luminosus]
MPADALYWSSVDFDSDESISNTFPRHYVDPWDLENYAYIREHLDSLEVSSEQSSFGEPTDINSSTSFYYTPVKAKVHSPKVTNERFDPFLDSDYGTAKYAEIEDVYGELPRRNNVYGRTRDYRKQEVEELYGIASFGLESSDGLEDTSYITSNNRSSSTTLYESARRRPEVTVKRRMSYSYGDYGYNPYQTVYSRFEESRRSDSGQPTPIYDDVRTNRFKPDNFGLSSYGHLQIDYSCSWNNLDKYIYN